MHELQRKIKATALSEARGRLDILCICEACDKPLLAVELQHNYTSPAQVKVINQRLDQAASQLSKARAKRRYLVYAMTQLVVAPPRVKKAHTTR